MLEPIKYTTISEICIRDLYFYDESEEEKLIEFCELNHITYLPGKDRKSCYRLINNEFERLDYVPDDLRCNPYDQIFEDSTIEKFMAGNHDDVMFVMENDLIKGVVHIVDYNNNNLYVELFRLLLKFEKQLRKLLFEKRKRNQDVLNYYKYKAKKNEFFAKRYEYFTEGKGQDQMKNSNELEAFYLRNLIMFALSQKILDHKMTDLNSITEIRNWVAHSQEVITINPSNDHPIYNIEGLKSFVRNVRSLFDAYDHLELELEKTLMKDSN